MRPHGQGAVDELSSEPFSKAIRGLQFVGLGYCYHLSDTYVIIIPVPSAITVLLLMSFLHATVGPVYSPGGQRVQLSEV